MQTLNGRKVKVVRMHTVAHAPGLGQIGPAIDANSGKTLGIMELFYYNEGVYFRCKGVEGYIPSGNVSSIVFEPETPVAAPVKK